MKTIDMSKPYAVIEWNPTGIYHTKDIIKQFRYENAALKYADKLFYQGMNVVVRTLKYMHRNPKGCRNMIRVCVYCKRVFGEKEPFEDRSETHGICDECFPKVMKSIKKEMRQLKKDEEA